MVAEQSIWSESERRAFCAPERLRISEWTEKYRVQPASVAAEAGPLRLSRTPYIYGLCDAFNEPGVEEVVFLKPIQVGYSTFLESLVGYVVDNDPGPILLVLPSKEAAQEVMDERIRPLIENTSALKRHASPHAHDSTLTAVKFDTCSLYMGWSGSPSTLARRAVRFVLFDEVDKFPKNSGREASPISLGTERTATYGYRRRVLIGSTPTLDTGAIWVAWLACGDKRRYYVPCPHCGEFQPLVFGQIKYPKLNIADKSLCADTIEAHDLAHYECVSCNAPIQNNAKSKMLSRGVWLSEGQTIDRDGTIKGQKPKAKRVGFWINSIYSPWRSFSAVAAEFLRSQGNPSRMQNFRNSWLAEPFVEIVKSSTVADFRKLTVGAPPDGIVPAWAAYIVASADVQKDRMYWIVRAWGANYQSQLIDYGVCGNFEELKQKTLETQFILAADGTTSRAHVLMVDARYRQEEVYEFSKQDERINVTMGNPSDSQKMLCVRTAAAENWGIKLWMLNTQLLKDRMASLRYLPGRWLLNSKVDDVYLQHLASEQKQLVKGVEMWVVKTQGAQNHYFDCETYSVAGAEICRVDLLQGVELPEHTGKEEIFNKAEQETFGKSSFLGDVQGWLSRN
jgi:phage terminase large subunit GpA-like protein